MMATQPGALHQLSPASQSRTALLLIDIQRGLNTSHGFYGIERSTPGFEENISSLLAACRKYNASLRGSTNSTSMSGTKQPWVEIFHVYHRSTNPLSPLHPSGATQKDGMDFMPCATPDADSAHERVFSKTTNSAFASGPELREWIVQAQVEQLVAVGIATDHCVTTTVRWASDLGIVGASKAEDYEREGKIVVVSDATACFGKEGLDAETVQKVHLASLAGEFATVMSSRDVLRCLFAE